MIPLSHILILGALLFAVGITGIFLNRRNMLRLLMCIELMLLAVNMNFIAFDYYAVGSLGNGGNEGDGILHGQIFVFFILTVAAAEAAIGLAILVALFRNRKSIDVQVLDKLKG